MDLDVVRFVIRRRLEEGLLPQGRMMRVQDTPGGGQMCDACGGNITSDQIAMVGATLEGGRRTRHFHALCFRIWDNERHLLSRLTA
jgi:hypothetical protein